MQAKYCSYKLLQIDKSSFTLQSSFNIMIYMKKVVHNLVTLSQTYAEAPAATNSTDDYWCLLKTIPDESKTYSGWKPVHEIEKHTLKDKRQKKLLIIKLTRTLTAFRFFELVFFCVVSKEKLLTSRCYR